MIPLKLVLKNFLSYRYINLDFTGLHTACICGANGSGKSSLLEAITWSLWGQSRVSNADDIIYTGAKDVRVDFTFQIDQEVYRVIRMRPRQKSGSLELQISSNNSLEEKSFKSLSAKKMVDTQKEINKCVKIDYQTFINSAYLRQGKADEFMLKTSSQRKEVLAELLKLSEYDRLAEKAKQKAKDYEGQVDYFEGILGKINEELQLKDDIVITYNKAEKELTETQEIHEIEQEKLNQLKLFQNQREIWENQLKSMEQQYKNYEQDCEGLKQRIAEIKQEQTQLESLLNQRETITQNYQQYVQLRSEEQRLDDLWNRYNKAQEKMQQLTKQQTKIINDLERELDKEQTNLEYLQKQEKDETKTITDNSDLEIALAKLEGARERLKYLDTIQLEVSPLFQRTNTILTEINRSEAKLSAQLKEKKNTAGKLQLQLQKLTQLNQKLGEIDQQIEALKKKQVHQQYIQEKGLEKRGVLSNLKQQQLNYETQLKEIEDKRKMLDIPDAICPLCDRPLDENHHHQIIQKFETQQQDIDSHLWDLETDYIIGEKEIVKLQEEYRTLNHELSNYNQLLDNKAQLIAQIQDLAEKENSLVQLQTEINHLETSLENKDYAKELQQELAEIETELKRVNYDDKDHVLARNEVDKLRSAEIKQAQVKQAQKKLQQLQIQKPISTAKIEELKQQIITEKTTGKIAEEIINVEKNIIEIGYDQNTHNNIKKAWREAQTWQNSYDKLQEAENKYPILVKQCADLTQSLEERLKVNSNLAEEIKELNEKLKAKENNQIEMKELEKKNGERQQQINNFLSQIGSLKQQLQHLEKLENQIQEKKQELETAKQQVKVHHALGEAFGKKGIQTLMIENILPQIEAESNSILARLTGNQLHVGFRTQKEKASASKSKKTDNLIDTLDILIADAQGTRPYETYSGGEAFRVNFAIRLALAKILTQRAGTALQMLIIDEGFGTQDQEGCERLIAAINAIAADFACILTITHVEAFKEAFPARIEVSKNDDGSHIILSV